MAKEVFCLAPDLNQHPSLDFNLQACELKENITDITLADLHGNPIKLLYILLVTGICRLSEDDYQQLLIIYLTPLDIA